MANKRVGIENLAARVEWLALQAAKTYIESDPVPGTVQDTRKYELIKEIAPKAIAKRVKAGNVQPMRVMISFEAKKEPGSAALPVFDVKALEHSQTAPETGQGGVDDD